MNTPISDFVKNYALSSSVRLHMPGHKGASSFGGERDITEVKGADVLYQARSIILESETNATKLFGSQKTLYSTEGSSLSIRAMLHLVKAYAKINGRKTKIIAGRNAHKTFVTASALLDFDVIWINSSQNGVLSCNIDTLTLEKEIIKEKPVAVYVTSPDYLGCVLDIKSLAELCHKHEVLLLVDNAHGAYLKFVGELCHPLDLGADLVCDSAHKTLPCLTGCAYLHVGKTAPIFFADDAENVMSLYASTSPSYLLLQSLDDFNKIISDNPEYFTETANSLDSLKEKLLSRGFTLVGQEVLKLTLSTKGYGYTGEEVAEILAKKNIVVEFADPDFVTMMFSPCNSDEDFRILEDALLLLERKSPLTTSPPPIPVLVRGMSMEKALFCDREEISVTRAEGRVLASPTVACPPAIPIAVCGEILDRRAIELFKYYGIDTCLVAK